MVTGASNSCNFVSTPNLTFEAYGVILIFGFLGLSHLFGFDSWILFYINFSTPRNFVDLQTLGE